MIYLVVILIVSAILFAYEEYCEWLGTKEADVREHVVSVAHRLSLVVLGYLYYTYVTLIDLPLLLGIYWLLCDGLMNKMKKRGFFAVSSQSGNPFEKWNIVKFSLIIIGTILIIIQSIWR